MTYVSYYSYIMYFCLYLSIMIIGFMFGILVYYNSIDDKDNKYDKDNIQRMMKLLKLLRQ